MTANAEDQVSASEAFSLSLSLATTALTMTCHSSCRTVIRRISPPSVDSRIIQLENILTLSKHTTLRAVSSSECAGTDLSSSHLCKDPHFLAAKVQHDIPSQSYHNDPAGALSNWSPSYDVTCLCFSTVFPPTTAFLLLQGFMLIYVITVVINTTSRASTPPDYHHILAFVGFLVSVAWIYALAAELVHVLQVRPVLRLCPPLPLPFSCMRERVCVRALVQK